MIKIDSYDKKNQKLTIITDMRTSLANAIRRSVLEIPVMAIDEVEIIKNDSALYDEILAHRLGSIPIKTEKGNKEVKFRLKEIGPKMIYSTDIKPSIGSSFKIPIVLLDKDQNIEVICDALMGKGIEHVKFSPGLAYFKHDVDDKILDYITINNEGKVSYDEEELINSKDLSQDLINEIKALKGIEDLRFIIESWGQFDVKEIFIKAIDTLEENLEELEKAVK